MITALLNTTLLLIHHALIHKRITGTLPDHRYMMQVFEISFESADYVLMVASLVSSAKEKSA